MNTPEFRSLDKNGLHDSSRSERRPTKIVTLPNLSAQVELVRNQTGHPFALMRNKGNPYVLPIKGGMLDSMIRSTYAEAGNRINKRGLEDINEGLVADAEMVGTVATWYRVAPIENGIEVDLGDDLYTRVRIANGNVDIGTNASNVLFQRSPEARPMVMPAKEGNFEVLKKYVNLDHFSFRLFRAWLSYTLAHPKMDGVGYVHLVLLGGQGTGKSGLSKIIKKLLDPSEVGVETFPDKVSDLAAAANQSHVVCFDNLRSVSKAMSDALCILSTRGVRASRALYTNSDRHLVPLHCAIVLNGIHHFAEESDLAQRCLTFHLNPINPKERRSEQELKADLDADLPAIQRGLFDDVARILVKLPEAKVTVPQRMVAFSRWLAAMELADEVPEGTYQSAYSLVITDGQREALESNLFAAAVLKFGEAQDDFWTGTPTKLLAELNDREESHRYPSSEWPSNAISLGKRLGSIEGALREQGINVQIARGVERMITIENRRNT